LIAIVLTHTHTHTHPLTHMLSRLNMFISFEALFGTQLVGHKRLWTALVKNNTTHNYVCIFVLSQSVLECVCVCICMCVCCWYSCMALIKLMWTLNRWPWLVVGPSDPNEVR